MSATSTLETFRCMMCGHEYQEVVEKGEDKERTCSKCRSNSIRRLKRPLAGRQAASGGTTSRHADKETVKPSPSKGKTNGKGAG